MPVLKTQETVEVSIDFSVYCGICGSGVCGDTDVDNRRGRITVTCRTCSQNIYELESRIKELENNTTPSASR